MSFNDVIFSNNNPQYEMFTITDKVEYEMFLFCHCPWQSDVEDVGLYIDLGDNVCHVSTFFCIERKGADNSIPYLLVRCSNTLSQNICLTWNMSLDTLHAISPTNFTRVFFYYHFFLISLLFNDHLSSLIYHDMNAPWKVPK